MAYWVMDIFSENWEDLYYYSKNVEARVPNPKEHGEDYSKIRENDELIYVVVDKNRNPKSKMGLIYPVEYNHKYENLEEMFEKEGLENILPRCNSIEEGVKKHFSYPDYEERIKKYGVFGIGLRKEGERIVKLNF